MSSLESLLKKKAGEIDAKSIARYIGGVGHPDRTPDETSQLKFLGISVPTLRTIVKQVPLPASPQALLDAAKSTRLYEARSCYLHQLRLMERQFEKSSAANPVLKLDYLQRWIPLVDNWACSDQLSDIVARAVEATDQAARTPLKNWNQSANPWARRQSIVGLYYYQRQRKKLPPPQWAAQLLMPLLDDPHFYVQRGVGWCLREWYQAAPELQVAFVKKHLTRISATAWFATAEKYPQALQKQLTRERAELRRSRETH